MVDDSGTPPSACGDASGRTDCDEALRELYTFLDGELTVERRETISRHLEGCGHCHEVEDFEVELRQVIATCCREAVPEHLKARVAAALEALRDGQGAR